MMRVREVPSLGLSGPFAVDSRQVNTPWPNPACSPQAVGRRMDRPVNCLMTEYDEGKDGRVRWSADREIERRCRTTQDVVHA